MPVGKHQICMNTVEEHAYTHVDLPHVPDWRRWAPLTLRIKPSQEIMSLPSFLFRKLLPENTNKQVLTPTSRFGIEDDLCLLGYWVLAIEEYRKAFGLQFEVRAAEKLNAFDR